MLTPERATGSLRTGTIMLQRKHLQSPSLFAQVRLRKLQNQNNVILLSAIDKNRLGPPPRDPIQDLETLVAALVKLATRQRTVDLAVRNRRKIASRNPFDWRWLCKAPYLPSKAHKLVYEMDVLL